MSEEIRNLIDSRTCHQCGKEMSVLYPHLWRYKRKVKFGRIYYFCSWSCLRAYEKKGETKVKLTSEQKQQAIEMAIAGTSPISFIRDCGVNNPENCWWYIKKKLKENDPETAAKIQGFRHPPKQVEAPESVPTVTLVEEPGAPKFTPEEIQSIKDAVPTVKVYGPLRVEIPEQEKKRIMVPLSHSGLRSTGWASDFATYSYDAKHECIVYEDCEGTEVCYTVDRWIKFFEEFRTAAGLLVVEL